MLPNKKEGSCFNCEDTMVFAGDARRFYTLTAIMIITGSGTVRCGAGPGERDKQSEGVTEDAKNVDPGGAQNVPCTPQSRLPQQLQCGFMYFCIPFLKKSDVISPTTF